MIWINHSGKYTFIYPLHLIWISSGQKLFELCCLSEIGLWYFIRKNCKFFDRFFSHKDFSHPHQFTHFCHIERTFLVINTLTLNLKDWSPQKKISRFIHFFYVDEKYDFWYEIKMYKNRTSSVTIITSNEILKKWNMAISLSSLSLLWLLSWEVWRNDLIQHVLAIAQNNHSYRIFSITSQSKWNYRVRWMGSQEVSSDNL